MNRSPLPKRPPKSSTQTLKLLALLMLLSACGAGHAAGAAGPQLGPPPTPVCVAVSCEWAETKDQPGNVTSNVKCASPQWTPMQINMPLAGARVLITCACCGK